MTEDMTESYPPINWSEMSYKEALRATEDTMLNADAESMGDGFTKLQSKDQLVGKAFFIVRGRFTTGIGKYGEKVTVRIITVNDERYYFSDGSEGIYKQLRTLVPEDSDAFGEVNCPKGLRASRFHWDSERGMVTKEGEPNAVTYYIDVS